MNVTSVVVETQPGMSGAVLHDLALMDRISVFGVKDDRMVVVLESATPDELESMTVALQNMEFVTSVNPVFSAHE